MRRVIRVQRERLRIIPVRKDGHQAVAPKLHVLRVLREEDDGDRDVGRVVVLEQHGLRDVGLAEGKVPGQDAGAAGLGGRGVVEEFAVGEVGERFFGWAERLFGGAFVAGGEVGVVEG